MDPSLNAFDASELHRYRKIDSHTVENGEGASVTAQPATSEETTKVLPSGTDDKSETKKNVKKRRRVDIKSQPQSQGCDHTSNALSTSSLCGQIISRYTHYDPADCIEILDSMYDRWYAIEDQYSAKPYLERQSDVNAKMRAILVDWLIEVHQRFKLQTPTLWLCVNILDRFLERKPTTRAQLQLVGVTALLIACKFEEIITPDIQDYVYITGKYFCSGYF